MQKKFLLLLSIISLSVCLIAQSKTVKPKIDSWYLDENTGKTSPAAVDTVYINLQQNNPMEQYSLFNSYNGIWGSPLQSKLYFDRTKEQIFLFSHPYDAYVTSPSEVIYYNTRTPFANIRYNTSGIRLSREEDFEALFTVNVNKRLNVGAMMDYYYGLGEYSRQKGKQFRAGLFSNYQGKRYVSHFSSSLNQFNNEENGGLVSSDYVTLPNVVGQYESANMPVNLANAQSRYKDMYLFYSQRVNIGNQKIVDTTSLTPSTPLFLTHTFKIRNAQRRYLDKGVDTLFYPTINFDSVATFDSVAYTSIKNKLEFGINEDYSKWIPFELTASLSHDYRSFYNLYDTIPQNEYEHHFVTDVHASNEKSKFLHYDFGGDYTLVGPERGDYKLDAGLRLMLKPKSDSIYFTFDAFVKDEAPSYFENKYYSNHYVWNYDFDKINTIQFNAAFIYKLKWLDLGVSAKQQRISNFIFFDENALPAQYNAPLEVTEARLKFNFHLRNVHFENTAIYQISDNESILSLPRWSAYSNWYVVVNMFKKVLKMQAGADVYYHTEYYAPNYMPATAAFYNQRTTKIGNYPLSSVYLNFHLKTASFFFRYYNYNEYFSSPAYFSMPNYPLHTPVVKMGVSWNFFD